MDGGKRARSFGLEVERKKTEEEENEIRRMYTNGPGNMEPQIPVSKHWPVQPIIFPPNSVIN